MPRKSKTKTEVLTELLESAGLRLLESQEGELRRVEGVASVGGKLNRNRRIYPTEVLRTAVEAAQKAVAEGELTGELEHPQYEAHGTLDRTAFRISRLWMEENVVKFEAVILGTECGEHLVALLEGGVKVGMSTRGLGVVEWDEQNGETVAIVRSYEFTGIDAVKRPSEVEGQMRLKESEEENMEIKTLKELREAFPELVKQLEGEARKELEVQVASLTSENAKLKAEAQAGEALVQEAQAKHDPKALLEAAKPLLNLLGLEQPLAESAKDESSKKLDQVLQENATLKEELGKAVRKIEERDRKETLNKAFEAKVKGHKYEEMLRESVEPEQFATPEALEAEVERLVKLAEAVAAKSKTPESTGKGQLAENHGNGDDQMKVWKTLAGI